MIARLLLDTNINKNAAGAEENFACIFMRQRKNQAARMEAHGLAKYPVLFSQSGFLRNGGFLVIAGERIVYNCLVRCRRNQADDRNQNQADNHSDSAALIGDCSSVGKLVRNSMFAIIRPQPKMKHTQHARRLVRFQYRPYRNGARNAPASAPHEMPIS